MKNQPNVHVILPVNDYGNACLYYREVLSFLERDGLFFLPIGEDSVALKLVEVEEGDDRFLLPAKRYMSFSYHIPKNFLSQCLVMYKNGAIFDMACEYPGGYFARVCDPDGNQFEIFCDSFDEDVEGISAADIPFFFRY